MNSSYEFGYYFAPQHLKQVAALHKRIYNEVRTRFQDPEVLDQFAGKKTIGRYFLAKDHDEEKTYDMWKNWMEWRIRDAPDKITDDSIVHELKAGKAFWHGKDKKGHPCLIVKAKKHIPGEIPVDETVRFWIYSLEKGLRKAQENGTDKICVIWDREGTTKKNIDTSFRTMFAKISKLLQECYAEILEKIYILHPSWLLKTMLPITRALISKRTSEKIVVVENMTELLDHFDRSSLLVEHGGLSTFQYEWPYALDDTDLPWYDCEETADFLTSGHPSKSDGDEEEDIADEQKGTIPMEQWIFATSSFDT